jgi:hypothetical protein
MEIPLRDLLRRHLSFRIATTDDDLDDLVEATVGVFRGIDDEDALVAAATDVAVAELAAHEAAQRSWPATTDCDRLELAFLELPHHGIAAVENFTDRANFGMESIGGRVELDEEQDVRGFAFYDEEDLEDAVDGDVLRISYGAFDGEPTASVDPARTAAIGREVVAVLRRHGLDVTWDGDIGRRIEVALVWQRRRR